MRRVAASLILLAAIASGCGGGDSGSKTRQTHGPQVKVREVAAKKSADEFAACFKQPGYTAKKPDKPASSTLAAMADAKGYDVASVDVARAGSSRPSAYVTFFDSTPKATDAQTKLKVRSYGGVPPQQRGSVVVGYLSVADMNAVDPAIQGCL